MAIDPVSIIIYIAILIGTMALTQALMEIPPDIDPAGLDDFTVNTAEEGRAVPVTFGTVLLKTGNVVFYGELLASAKHGDGGWFHSDPVIGHTYYMTMHMVLTQGTIDGIKRVVVGEVSVWDETELSWEWVTIVDPLPEISSTYQSWQQTGDMQGELNENEGIFVSKPELYGGETGAGGISGHIFFEFGRATQGQNAVLQRATGETNIPAHRGVTGVIFDQFRFGDSPYLKHWWFEVRRNETALDGSAQWYQEKASIGLGMNPAHILREILTSPILGSNINSDLFPEDDWQAAADQLYEEEFGLNFMYAGSDSKISDFVSVVERHIDGRIVEDATTGEFRLVLFRGGYTVAEKPQYDEADIIRLEDFKRASTGENPNEVVITYTDRATYGKKTVTVHNTAHVFSTGKKVTMKEDYLGIMEPELANKVATRELMAYGSGLFTTIIVGRRSMLDVKVGDVIRVSYAKYGLVDAAVRVMTVEHGYLGEDVVRLGVSQDVFAIGDTVYANPNDTKWTETHYDPVDLADTLILDAPYKVLTERYTGAAEWTGARCYLIAVAKREAGQYGFRGYQDQSGDYQFDGEVSGFSPTFTLPSNLAASTADAVITPTDLDMTYEIWHGMLVSVGDELMCVVGFNGEDITLRRGVCDTTPKDHLADDMVWCFDRTALVLDAEFQDSDTFNVKLQSRTALGLLDLDNATAHAHTTALRYLLPYVPADFKYTGTTTHYIRWRTRNRLTDVGIPLAQTAGSVTPEAGTTYDLTIKNDGVMVREVLGLTSGTAQYNYVIAERLADFGDAGGGVPDDALGTYHLKAVRDGYESWDEAVIPV